MRIQLEVFTVLLWILLRQLLLKCCYPCVSLLKEKLINIIVVLTLISKCANEILHLYVTNLYNHYINILHDILMRVCYVSVLITYQDCRGYFIYTAPEGWQNQCDTDNREHTVRNCKTTIHHILIFSYILIVIMSTTLTLKILSMQTHSIHPLLNNTIWKCNI
jgi:hypothetical protein